LRCSSMRWQIIQLAVYCNPTDSSINLVSNFGTWMPAYSRPISSGMDNINI